MSDVVAASGTVLLLGVETFALSLLVTGVVEHPIKVKSRMKIVHKYAIFFISSSLCVIIKLKLTPRESPYAPQMLKSRGRER